MLYSALITNNSGYIFYIMDQDGQIQSVADGGRITVNATTIYLAGQSSRLTDLWKSLNSASTSVQNSASSIEVAEKELKAQFPDPQVGQFDVLINNMKVAQGRDGPRWLSVSDTEYSSFLSLNSKYSEIVNEYYVLSILLQDNWEIELTELV